MKFQVASLLLLVATILPSNAIIAPNSYVISNAGYMSQILVPSQSLSAASVNSPVGWSQGDVPSADKQWDVNPITQNGFSGWSIYHSHSKKYLSLVDNKIALDSRPFPWLILDAPSSNNNGLYRIQDPRSRSAALGLSGSKNGDLLSLQAYSEKPTQHWIFQ
ncbi:hypothetical protein FBU30_009327 [Linnemannia zychae]|nr:hypothetical protein FBU30_009327 [Linnemannia zychae]